MARRALHPAGRTRGLRGRIAEDEKLGQGTTGAVVGIWERGRIMPLSCRSSAATKICPGAGSTCAGSGLVLATYLISSRSTLTICSSLGCRHSGLLWIWSVSRHWMVPRSRMVPWQVWKERIERKCIRCVACRALSKSRCKVRFWMRLWTAAACSAKQPRRHPNGKGDSV